MRLALPQARSTPPCPSNANAISPRLDPQRAAGEPPPAQLGREPLREPKRLVSSAGALPAREDRLDLPVREALPAADGGSVERAARPARDPPSNGISTVTQRRSTYGRRLQASSASSGGSIGATTAGHVGRERPLGGAPIERRAGRHEVRDVGDVHPRRAARPPRADRDRVVEVLRRVRVDREGEQVAQVDALRLEPPGSGSVVRLERRRARPRARAGPPAPPRSESAGPSTRSSRARPRPAAHDDEVARPRVARPLAVEDDRRARARRTDRRRRACRAWRSRRRRCTVAGHERAAYRGSAARPRRARRRQSLVRLGRRDRRRPRRPAAGPCARGPRRPASGTGRRELQRRSVRERLDRLDERLAEGGLADELGALVVAQRRGDDLGGARACTRFDRGRRAAARGPGRPAARSICGSARARPRSQTTRPLEEERGRTRPPGRAARPVVAQVEHEPAAPAALEPPSSSASRSRSRRRRSAAGRSRAAAAGGEHARADRRRARSPRADDREPKTRSPRRTSSRTSVPLARGSAERRLEGSSPRPTPVDRDDRVARPQPARAPGRAATAETTSPPRCGSTVAPTPE